MHGKEFFIDVIRTYFSVVTLINVAMLIMGLHIFPDSRFGYEAFAAPLIYGAAGTLPNIVMYSKRELKVKELLFRKILQFILIEVVVLFVAFGNQSETVKQPQVIISVAISILVIYIIASIVDWIQNSISAKKITVDLIRFQEENKNDYIGDRVL